MAKRHGTMRRYRAEEVLEIWDDVEGDFEGSGSDMSDGEMELDDPDEPIMPGSDDEFSDLEEVAESDSEEDGPPGSLHGTPSHSSPPKAESPSHFMTANLIATAVTLEAEESNLPGALQGTPSHPALPMQLLT